MLFSKNFRVLSIFALIAAAPHAVLAATPAGDSTITSKRYVDNKIPADSTAHLLVTPQASGGNATKRAITTAGANITNLASSSATGATNIPTAYAVKEAIGSATSGIITDVSGKQDKDNNQIYKVGYNGGWANANTAVAVDTTYLDKTNNDNGSVTVKVDTTKLASAKTDITNLTSSSTAANRGKLTTAYAVKQSLDDKQNKLPYDATANLIIAPTTDGGEATKRAIATAGTDITDLTSSSTDTNKIKIPTAYAVKQGLDGKQNKLPYDATANLIIAPTTNGGNATKRAITTAGTGITGLETSSSSGATNIPTAYAVKEAIGSATSGIITDVSGKQDKDNNEVYKVGYNGGWANANTAVAVDTTYLKKTDNTDGSVKVEVDANKMTTSGTSGLSTSSTKLVQEKAIADALALKQQKITHSSTNKVVITPTTDGGATGTRDITTAGANITGLESASSSGATNIPTAYAVKEAIGTAVSGADISAHTVNGAPLSNEASYFYGSGVGTATNAAKTVQIDSITTSPTAGMTIVVNPATTNTTAYNLTLKLNSGTAARIKYNGSTAISADDAKRIWRAGVPVVFVYDGTYWVYAGREYSAGTGISIDLDTNAISNAGVRSVATGTGNDGTISVNTNGTPADVAVKGWNKTVKYDGTNAVGSLTKGVWVDTDGTVKAMTHSVNADVPSTAEFTDTTYSFATGSDSGTISVTPEGGSAYNVTVKDAEVTTHKLAQGDATDTVITSSATDTQYPSAKAVYNAITSATNAADISDHTVNGAPLSNAASYYYAESRTAADTATKVVNIPSITSLQAGQIIAVKPTETSTVKNSTIKLNDFAAYPMRYNGAAITTTTDSIVWNANYVSFFVFDGTYWQFAGGGIDNNTTYTALSVTDGTAGTATNSRTVRADYLKQIIQGTTLTGIDTTTQGAVAATDTVTTGIGKLQATKQDKLVAGTNITIAADGKTISATDTTYDVFTTSANGLVPASSSNTGKFLRGDGTWATPTDTNTTYSVFTGATANANGTSGLVKAPSAGDQGKFLRGDGTWAVDNNTTYSVFTGATASAAGTSGLVKAPAAGDQAKFLRGDGTWAGEFTGATSSADGAAGLVKKPLKANKDQFLKGDGTWGTPTDTNTTYNVFTGATSSSDGSTGLVKKPVAGDQDKFLKGDGTWAGEFTGATSSAAGTAGLVKKPAAGDQAKYLRGDGTWAGEFTGATSSAAGTAGLVKKPAAGDQAKYLRGDGTWAGEFTGATSSADGAAGLVKKPLKANKDQFLKGDGTWGTPTDTNTTYTADEETISKDSNNEFSAMTAAVAQNGKALTTGGQVYTYAQPKTTGTIYKIGYNGTWSNLGTTLDPSATGYVADNAVTAATIANAISSAVSGADISAHTVNGAPLSNTASYYYGSGVGAAGTAAKTVTISSITTAPTEGMTIVVNPATTASTETSLTLNLNNTGAKTVKYNGLTTLTAEQSKAIWKKDVPVVFVYDGTNWLYSGKEYTAGTGISISDANAITNTGVRAVTASGTSAADGTISVNTNGESANVAVKGWDNKQTKPSSVSNGKVLTYTGTNANSNVTAKYIQVPVATGDPNDGGTLNSTNPLASIWVE